MELQRYFIEVAYKGTAYSGFQVQENAHTVQAEVAKAFETLHRRPVALTGSSRTDAGVHALQNYFHFDDALPLNPQFVYKMNAVLPRDLVVRQVLPVPATAHSRFDAVSREYIYRLHRFKNPFLNETSHYFPYPLDLGLMRYASEWLMGQTNFFAFSKTNTQVKNFHCRIDKCEWVEEGESFYFNVRGNRFLRGMVRLLTATLLKLGRGKLSLAEFGDLFEGERKCGFSLPAHGLFLVKVNYPENFFADPARL